MLLLLFCAMMIRFGKLRYICLRYLIAEFFEMLRRQRDSAPLMRHAAAFAKQSMPTAHHVITENEPTVAPLAP